MSKKPKSNTAPARGKSKSGNSDISGFMLTCTDIMSRVGMPGFLMIAIITCTIFFSNSTQKEEMIDKWLLFNNNPNSNTFAISVIVFAVLIYIVQAYTFFKLRALDKAEIDRLSKYKKEYQEERIDRSLKSSIQAS